MTSATASIPELPLPIVALPVGCYGASADLSTMAAAILGFQTFVVTSHARPDGDAVGSALACAEMLRYLGKQCDVVFADPIPQVYLTLPGVENIIHAGRVDPDRYDCAIVLECDSTARTGLRDLQLLPLLNIDHHITGCNFGALNWIDDAAAAVACLVYQLARFLQVPVTPAMATCLYTALFTDTGAFTYPGTAHGAFPVAQELIACGADADRIARDVLYSVSTAHIRLLGTALSRMQVHGATAWSYITLRDLAAFDATDEDSEGTVDYLISIAGVDAALFLREVPHDSGPQRFRASLRSKSDLDVSSVALEYGGGGHQRAAGCSIEGSLENVSSALLQGLQQRRGALG
ncbi:DHH family phosphoesterase [Terriglobus aquaticus]|uniref:DHH family phosphoesterase n=1 Tax=Terriglobus aquaticus TaxID=940139 RepID=A0ABW9KQW7_9BACT|nr:bifunctional oligoribonuclease/PAP phosphatase NrnA [Terriglobus aquaticus]